MTSATPAAAVRLQCGWQCYDWGKEASTSEVASLLKRHGESGKFAELWMGTHPTLPSRAVVSSTAPCTVPLTEFLSTNPSYFSAKHAEHPHFSGQVPFLLKVLSIAKALSVQAHPNKKLAEQLHQLDPKNYRDANHKPELIVALTPFHGLCCFRRVEDIMRFVRRAPPLEEILCGCLPADGAPLSKDAERDVLRSIMKTLYTSTSKETMERAVQAHKASLESLKELSSSPKAEKEDEVFLQLATDFPGDVGCWMVYILNLVHLQPGEGLFLRDGEPHAYLSGDGVEVMATSDNVVRAGLTPKYMDVPTLLSMLSYDTDGLREAFRPALPVGENGALVQRYLPTNDFADFSLYRVVLASTASSCLQQRVNIELPTLGIAIVLDGVGVVNAVHVHRGDVVLLPSSVEIVRAEESVEDVPFTLFIASSNDL